MIFLAQTDTTAGFLSKDYKLINLAKKRPINTSCIITTAYFKELKNLTRIPNIHKNLVRKAKKTSFLYPNLLAIRVIKDCPHEKFLQKNGWFYSSSANKHHQAFDEKWAKDIANKIINHKLYESTPSTFIKLTKSKKIKIR